MLVTANKTRIMEYIEDYGWHWDENEKSTLVISTQPIEKCEIWAALKDGMDPKLIGFAQLTQEHLAEELDRASGLDEVINIENFHPNYMESIITAPILTPECKFADSDDFADNDFDFIIIDGVKFDMDKARPEALFTPLHATHFLIQ